MRFYYGIIGAILLLVTSCQLGNDGSMSNNDSRINMPPDSYRGPGDHHLWLEDIEGKEALQWVRAQNARSLGELESHPDYQSNYAAAVEATTKEARLAYGTFRDGFIYNFWQDSTNVRGIWRRTSLESYMSIEPEWETLIDFDQLAESEGANWVYKGVECYRNPEATRNVCMVRLSDGGKDAVTLREFDLDNLSFVEGGFESPESKQFFAWLDVDTALLATNWGEGTLTESGYPFIIKKWKRGTPMPEATEYFRGDKQDVLALAFGIDPENSVRLPIVMERDTFFSGKYHLMPEGQEKITLPVPPNTQLVQIMGPYYFVELHEEWTPEGSAETFQSGDIVAINLLELLETRILPPVELVFRPTSQQSFSGIAVAKGGTLIAYQEDVISRIAKLERQNGEWVTHPIELPGKGRASFATVDRNEETVFINFESFLQPDSILVYSTSTEQIEVLKSLPASFDTSDMVTEQFFARSKDGTLIPYFVVRKRGVGLNGKTPTLLYGYGGFLIPITPSYSETYGRLWLEKGGVYVVANIRGGSEYGPDWHQAGLKTNRQRIYDDFIAVAEDLIERNITSPEHLGIMGGSNGGLLMGVMLNQRPDLWNAAVVLVPLLDMLRYHLLLAGASWVDEYGSPEVPEERVFLEQISPYHNFDPLKDYPKVLFVTSTKDDRVHPGHARKMAKLFEDAGMPFVYYENIDGGHSASANQLEMAKRNALTFSYLTDQLFPQQEKPMRE